MLTPEKISEIADFIEEKGTIEALLPTLRQRYSGIHFTYCLDDQVAFGIAPVMQRMAFNLYAVDGRQHCARFTPDLEVASGLVVAEVLDG